MKIESVIIYTITFLSIALLGFLLFFRIFYHGLLYPAVSIASMPMGGIAPDKAKVMLEQKVSAWSASPLTFAYKNRVIGITPADLGIKIKTDEMIKKAFSYGHDQNLLINLIVFTKTLNCFKPYAVDAITELDYEKFLASTDKFFQNIEIKKTNATVAHENGKFAIKSSSRGMEVDKNDLLNKLQNNAMAFSAAPIELKLTETFPDIEPAETLSAKQRAEKITASTLTLSFNDKTWSVPAETFAKWIKFAVATDPANASKKILALGADKEAAKDYLETLVPEINKEPVNAELTVKNNKVEVFALSQDGIELKINGSIETIDRLIKDEKWINDSPAPLTVDKKAPLVTTDSINNLGITSRIGIGTSNFAGSPKNRRHNINVGAAKFHGVLIKPGEEFSFAEALGPITTKEGYRAELVIKNGATVPELGGGLCQVSTTAFRAAIYAGLPIIERQAHAYPVVYYNPQGMDSTVYPPHPDLRFINDTPGYILIQTKVEGNSLAFEFYGAPDGRQVKIRGPQIYDKKEDGSMKAVFYRDIYRDNELVRTDTFRSSYKSPALYPHKNPLD